MTEPHLLTLHHQIADISALEWDACAGIDNPFVSHAFLAALDESSSVGDKTGWIPQYGALRNEEGRLDAVVPMYLKTHSYGEYVFDHGWADAFERVGGSYYPKLQISVPFSPVPGPRLLRRKGAILSYEAIGNALKDICHRFELSSAHITFCTKEEWAELGRKKWLQRLGTQFHWHTNGYTSFEDFLSALSSNHRKSIRRERREANECGLIFKTLRGAEITEVYWDAFYTFYQTTIDRKWGSVYLTRDFFSLLSKNLGDQVVLMLAERDNKPIAGALHLVGADTLYGRNWGCIEEWPFLHFELCYYRAIEFAITHGLKRIEAGAQGAHKIQRGYVPQATYSVHWIEHKGLASAIEDFLVQERVAMQSEMEALSAYAPFKREKET